MKKTLSVLILLCMMTMLATALAVIPASAAFADDELDISSHKITGVDKNGTALQNSKGETDLTKLIDGDKNTNVYMGAGYTTKWETYNTPYYNIDIELDGTESFSGMRVYYRAYANNWDGILNNWSVYVLFKGEESWVKLGYTWNMNQYTTPQTITAGYNVSNVSKVRFQAIDIYSRSSNSSYLVIPEIALIKADGTKNTFKSTEDITAIPAAEKLIDEIGEVNRTADCLKKIEAAESACDALTEDQRARVRNYSTLTAAREEYDNLTATLADDEINLKGHKITGVDGNGDTLKNSNGEVDLSKLIDGKEENITIGAEYVSGWTTYNTMPYYIDIELDGTESFSGMRVYHKTNAWTNWDGVLNDWNVHVMFKGETEWKKLAYDYNRRVDKNGSTITNVPNGSIGATSTLFGYNVANVAKVRFEPRTSLTGSGMPMRLMIPEIALIKADGTKTTFSASSDIDDVNKVIVAIDSLGSAVLTSEFYSKLSTVEKAYAALTEHRKTLVINYAKLASAREAYDSLLKAALTLSIAADSGVYTDGTGVIRFISTFGTIPETAEIESYGTYVLNLNAFKSGTDWNDNQCAAFTSSSDGTPESGEAFAVDLNVPKDNLGTNVVAMSFVKLKGSDNLIPTFFTAGVNVLGINDNVKNLGEKSE